MIQEVKLGTHKIGTYVYAISKCVFVRPSFGNSVLKKKIIKKWVWKGVWPQEGLNGAAYDDTEKLLGSNFEKFVTVTITIGRTI